MGSPLLHGGRLAAAEARMAARATGLALPRGAAVPATGVTQREAVELLRAVAAGVGLLRCAATGWRRPACATPGARSTKVSGQV
jgi:hypothetical protein